MFAVHEVTVGVPLAVATARLAGLAAGDGLDGVSEAAYEGGLAIVRVGPLGSVRGLSKLVKVRFLQPVQHGATMTIPLRWEATGAAGELFPVLDADLMLARDGGERTLLALAGSYRPPFGKAGTVLDRAIMHRIAAATIRSLAERLAQAIAHPAAQHSAADPARPHRPLADTGEP